MIRRLVPMLLLAGCATQEARDASMHAWTNCIASAVARLDDGRTDPVSMAAAISPYCAQQYQIYWRTMASPIMTERGEARAAAEMRDNEVRLVAAAIVEHRARQRK